MDDGNVGAFSSVNSNIGSSTFKYTVSSGLTIGSSYRFKVTAYNDVGSVVGNIVSIIAANPPDAPTVGPTFDSSETN